jgi:hypothetical protein
MVMLKRMGYPVALALGLIVAGFVVLGIAWNGAAGVNCVDCQIPYLLSGGAVGLGLIIVGAGVLLFETGRRATSGLEQRLLALQEAIGAGGISPNGRAAGPAVAPSKEAVVVGKSSFHTQDCRLVEGKSNLEYASMDEALARGLSACRVCDPIKAFAKK